MEKKYANIELKIKSYSNLGLGNSSNYQGLAKWNEAYNGNVTSIGSNGDSSPYGLFDTMGQLYEWTETSDEVFPRLKFIRGGSYADNSPADLIAIKKFLQKDMLEEGCFGMRIASSGNPNSFGNFVTISGCSSYDHAIYDTNECEKDSSDNVLVVDPKSQNNIGLVNYDFKINKYLVTNTEYCEYLNTVDPYGSISEIYDYRMGVNSVGGIRLKKIYENPTSGNFYVVKSNMNNKPATYITWEKAAIYCNWLTHNKTSNFNLLNNGSYEIVAENTPIWNGLKAYYINDIIKYNDDCYKAKIDFDTSCPSAFAPSDWFCCPDNKYSAPTSDDCPVVNSLGYKSFDPISFPEGWELINKKRSYSGTYFLPNNNEWHKAALYNPISDEFWKYSTSIDTAPYPILCDTTGVASNVAGYFEESEKTFPIIIFKEYQQKTIDPNVFTATINHSKTPDDFQNNVFFIKTDIQGAKSGELYSYLYSSSSGTDWPSYISPKSGTFIADKSGEYSINNILKFCPMSRYSNNGINSSYNLDYIPKNNLLVENIAEQGTGTLILQINVSGSNGTNISKKDEIIGTNLPILPRNDVIDIFIKTSSGNSIVVSGDLCGQYIPIVAVAKPANAFTKIGETYSYIFTAEDQRVTIIPSYGEFSISSDHTKITAILSLNGAENTSLNISVSTTESNFANSDYINIICLDKC